MIKKDKRERFIHSFLQFHFREGKSWSELETDCALQTSRDRMMHRSQAWFDNQGTIQPHKSKNSNSLVKRGGGDIGVTTNKEGPKKGHKVSYPYKQATCLFLRVIRGNVSALLRTNPTLDSNGLGGHSNTIIDQVDRIFCPVKVICKHPSFFCLLIKLWIIN